VHKFYVSNAEYGKEKKMSSKSKPKQKLIVYEFLILLALGLLTGTVFGVFGKSIAAETALTFLGAITDISATMLSIFFAAALLLMGRSQETIRKLMSKSDFIAGTVLFTSAILHSLISILAIEPDVLIDLRTFDATFLVVMPLNWMIFAIVVVCFFIWKLMFTEPQTDMAWITKEDES
jgi:hypothetical protein